MKKKIFSLLMVFCMVLSLLPATAFAGDPENDGESGGGTTAGGDSGGDNTGASIQLGVGDIHGYDATNGYDYIYFGQLWSPLKWRVLDTKTSYDGENDSTGFFLLSEYAMEMGGAGYVTYTDDSADTWYTATGWCNFIYNDYIKTSKEDVAVLATNKTENEYYDTTDGNESFTANTLTDAKLFNLSAAEVQNATYGLDKAENRIALTDGQTSTGIDTSQQKAKGFYWLRSKWKSKSGFMGTVSNANGRVGHDGISHSYFTRPAFNLDKNQVVMVSSAVGGKAGTVVTESTLNGVGNNATSEWKLTLKDSDRAGFMASATSEEAQSSGYSIDYSGAQVGDNEYVSALVKDSDGNVKSYGKLVNVKTDEQASGTVNLNVTLAAGDELYVFNEQCNGDYKTDYSGELIPVAVSGKYAVSVTTGNLENISKAENSGATTQIVEPNSALTPIVYKPAEGYYFEALTVSDSDGEWIEWLEWDETGKIYWVEYNQETQVWEPQTDNVKMIFRPDSLTITGTPNDNAGIDLSKYIRVIEKKSYTIETADSIQLGAAGIKGYSEEHGYNHIYFGTYNKKPVYWRVLSDKAIDGSDGRLLLSEYLLGNVRFGGDTDSVFWADSAAKKWCGDFATENLAANEQAAVKTVSKESKAVGEEDEKYECRDALDSEKVFLLSVWESYTMNYGFSNGNDLTAYFEDQDVPGIWWLRSTYVKEEEKEKEKEKEKEYYAYLIYGYGIGLVATEDYTQGTRPALNLDDDQILMVSSATDVKTGEVGVLAEVGDNTTSEWKLTLKDESRSDFAVTETSVNGKAGSMVTLNYTGATVNDEAGASNEYVSAVIVDSNDKVLYYGRLAKPAEASGKLSVTIPENLEDGTYTLKVFSEQCNGDKASDYASEMKNVTLTVGEKKSSGGGGGKSTTPSYSMTVDKAENGTVTVADKSAKSGETVTITVKPDEGYVLDGLTVTDKNNNQIKLTDKGDGQYTFMMPGGDVSIKAVFAKKTDDSTVTPDVSGFVDVKQQDYFYNAVEWAAKKGITVGIDKNTFGSGLPCIRGQMITFLWRAAGCPKATTTTMPFTDVASGSYCYDAVLWGIENGIVKGTSETTFSPDATCTRAHGVTFLYRIMGNDDVDKSGFVDVPAGCYYEQAVDWAAAGGITKGTSESMFSPDNTCTRAQIVTFLYRAYNGK